MKCVNCQEEIVFRSGWVHVETDHMSCVLYASPEPVAATKEGEE